MKNYGLKLAFAVSLLASGAAHAQAPADPAKGNAPLKPAHTLNDGGARHGANSFTEGQARTHIEKSGFTAVTGLAKGRDGVWRGQATRNGQVMDVAMDFKGNVTTPLTAANSNPPAMPMVAPPTGDNPPAAASTASTATTSMHHRTVRHHRRHRRHRRAHGMAGAGNCANPGSNGAACSGIDRNHNGISDKEDRAIKSGAKP